MVYLKSVPPWCELAVRKAGEGSVGEKNREKTDWDGFEKGGHFGFILYGEVDVVNVGRGVRLIL